MRQQSSRRTGGAIGTKMFLNSMTAMAGLLVASVLAAAPPAFSQDLKMAKKGTLVCIAAQRVRPAKANDPDQFPNAVPTEITFSGVALRNYDSDRSIFIDEITVYNKGGNPTKTLSDGGFGGIEGFNPTGPVELLPHRTKIFSTLDLTGGLILPSYHPNQVVIEWSADKSGIELWGNTGRVDAVVGDPEGTDPVKYKLGAIKSRGNLRCAAIAGSRNRDRDDDDD